MTTKVYNKFHNYERTIKHRGEVPGLSTLRKALRESKPKDCKSSTYAVREDGRQLTIINRGQGMEVCVMS